MHAGSAAQDALAVLDCRFSSSLAIVKRMLLSSRLELAERQYTTMTVVVDIGDERKDRPSDYRSHL